VTIILSAQLIAFIYGNDYYVNYNNIILLQHKDWSLVYQISKSSSQYNFTQLGYLMYSQYCILVCIASIILLTAILGAISIVNYKTKINFIDVKQQNYYKQNNSLNVTQFIE